MLSSGTKGALLAGLYGIDQPMPFDCDTGNCTWPQFTTLGICSYCENVTAHTRVDTIKGPVSMTEYYIYSTPRNFSVWLLNTGRSAGTTLLNSTARKMSSDWDTQVDQQGKVVEFAFAKWERYAAHVEECEITWCARTYMNASVTRTSFKPGPTIQHQLQRTNSTGIRSWAYQEFHVPQSDDSFLGNRSFFVNYNDHSMLGDLFSSTFTTDSYNDTGQVLSLSTNVSKRVNDAIVSMSYSMGNSQNASEVRGDATVQEVYFHIRSTWLSLPIAMVVLTLIFLTATIVSSFHKSVLGWKSTSIVPLFADLYGWDVDELKVVSSTSVEQRSKSMLAIINLSNDGTVYFERSG